MDDGPAQLNCLDISRFDAPS
ncbi:protein of unknown function (plasmid) [Pseudolactococcus piscium]|nr:protein of unknown function [Lactococcus piscium]